MINVLRGGTRMSRSILSHEDFVPVLERGYKYPWEVRTADAKIVIVNDYPYRMVFFQDILFYKYPCESQGQEKIAAIMLDENGCMSGKELAELFGVHPNTIANWKNKFYSGGPEALIPKKPVGKPPKQTSEEVRDYVKKLWYEEDLRAYKDINAAIAQKFGFTISRSSFTVICSKARLRNDNPQQETIFDFLAQAEPSEQVTSDEPVVEAQQETEVPDVANPPVAANTPLPEQKPSNEDEEKDDSCVEPARTKGLEDGQTVTSRYGAVLLYCALIHDLFRPIFRHIQINMDRFHSGLKQFDIQQLVVSLLLMFLLRIFNPEQTKAIAKAELGVLYGRRQGVCCKTLRSSLHYLTQNNFPVYLPLKLAKQYVRNGYVQLGVIYFDGHFVPYWGKANLAKGYYPQRRLAVPGHAQYWVNDKNGKPVFFYLRQAFQKFSGQLPQMVKEILALQANLDMSDRPLIVVFDREGYSAQLLRELDELKVGWITWKKYATQYDENKFTDEIEITDAHGKTEKLRMFTTTTKITGYRDDIETIVLLDEQSGKQASIITNTDRILGEDYSPKEAVFNIKNRWSQENFFKQAKEVIDLDHQMGYDIEESTDDYPVPNPDHKDLKKEVDRLKRKFEKADNKRLKIYERYYNLKRKKPFDQYLQQQGNSKVLVQYQETKQALEKAQVQLQQTPETVPYSKLDDGNKEAIDFGRSIVVTSLKVAVYNMRKQMEDLAAECFSDYRELSKFMTTLMRAETTITRDKGTYHVQLELDAPPRYLNSTQLLLDKINAHNPRSVDGANMALKFHLKEKSG